MPFARPSRAQVNTHNVYPLDDVQEHSLSQYCLCHPRLQEVGLNGLIIIHNSWDGRERTQLVDGN